MFIHLKVSATFQYAPGESDPCWVQSKYYKSHVYRYCLNYKHFQEPVFGLNLSACIEL